MLGGGKHNQTGTDQDISAQQFNNQSSITLAQIEAYFKQHNIKSMIWENNQLLVQAETNPTEQAMAHLAQFCQANQLKNFTSKNLTEFKKNFTEKQQTTTNSSKILP